MVAGEKTDAVGAPSNPTLPPPPRQLERSGPSLGESLDHQRILDEREHAENVLRLRRVLGPSSALWMLFGVLDVLVAKVIEPGPLLPFVVIRVIGSCIILLAWSRLGRPPRPSPRAFRALEVSLFTSCTLMITIMGLWYRGITTPYFTGVILVLIARGGVIYQPWRQGLWQLGIPALAHPLFFFVVAPVSPAIRAQLTDSHQLALFAQNQFFVLGCLIVLVVTSHVVWVMRRQLFAARSIGRYRLTRMIGKGAMGEVWAAYDHTLERPVALKILRPDSSGVDLARFEREVKATSELSHLNTVRIFDYGATEDGLWYYAMELLEGGDLRTLVDREGALTAPRVLHLVGQAARALEEAHRHGIVHRDVKPENLLVATVGGETDVIKVVDFGIARLTNNDDHLTQTGSIAGTPAYMAPEVARGAPADPRADVYSLGASAYFALTGRPPFVAESMGALLHAHMTEPVVPPGVRAPTATPSDLEAVVLRCLDKNPDGRYADASELAIALESCLDAGRWRPARGEKVVMFQDASQPVDPMAETSR